MQLTHTRLLVDNVEGCKDFYAHKLALGEPVVSVEGIYYEFTAGPGRLGLYKRELMQSLAGVTPAGTGLADRALLTFQVADVDTAYKELSAKSVTFVTEPHDQEAWVLRVAHLRDPEGNLIEINARLKQQS